MAQQGSQNQSPDTTTHPGGTHQGITERSADPEERNLIQQRLELLVRAQMCQRRQRRERESLGSNRNCGVPHCMTMKNVLNHMTSCQVGINCSVPQCSSSREIINHWTYCTYTECGICLPLRTRTNNPGAVGACADSMGGISGAVGAGQHVVDPNVFRPSLYNAFRIIESNQQGLINDNDFFNQQLLSALQPGQVTVTPVQGFKKWHQYVTPDLRNHHAHKFVQAIFSILDAQAMLEPRMGNLKLYAKKVEDDMYKMANSYSEYLDLLDEKVYKIRKELEEKWQQRREQQLQAQQQQPQQQPGASVPSRVMNPQSTVNVCPVMSAQQKHQQHQQNTMNLMASLSGMSMQPNRMQFSDQQRSQFVTPQSQPQTQVRTQSGIMVGNAGPSPNGQPANNSGMVSQQPGLISSGPAQMSQQNLTTTSASSVTTNQFPTTNGMSNIPKASSEQQEYQKRLRTWQIMEAIRTKQKLTTIIDNMANLPGTSVQQNQMQFPHQQQSQSVSQQSQPQAQVQTQSDNMVGPTRPSLNGQPANNSGMVSQQPSIDSFGPDQVSQQNLPTTSASSVTTNQFPTTNGMPNIPNASPEQQQDQQQLRDMQIAQDTRTKLQLLSLRDNIASSLGLSMQQNQMPFSHQQQSQSVPHQSQPQAQVQTQSGIMVGPSRPGPNGQPANNSGMVSQQPGIASFGPAPTWQRNLTTTSASSVTTNQFPTTNGTPNMHNASPVQQQNQQQFDTMKAQPGWAQQQQQQHSTMNNMTSLPGISMQQNRMQFPHQQQSQSVTPQFQPQTQGQSGNMVGPAGPGPISQPANNSGMGSQPPGIVSFGPAQMSQQNFTTRGASSVTNNLFPTTNGTSTMPNASPLQQQIQQQFDLMKMRYGEAQARAMQQQLDLMTMRYAQAQANAVQQHAGHTAQPAQVQKTHPAQQQTSGSVPASVTTTPIPQMIGVNGSNQQGLMNENKVGSLNKNISITFNPDNKQLSFTMTM